MTSAGVKVGLIHGRWRAGPDWRTAQKAAIRDRKALQAQVQDGIDRGITPGRTTVAEACALWFEGANEGVILSTRNRPYAPKTISGYVSQLELHALPVIGPRRIDDIKRADVQNLTDLLMMKRSSRPGSEHELLDGQTVRNVINALGALYSYLISRHPEILVNPTRGVRLPQKSPPRDRVVPPSEMRELIGVLDEQDQPVFAMAFLAGLRRSEIRGLRREHIDLDSNLITVPGTKSETAIREVPILNELRPYLEAAISLREAASSELLFFGRGRWGDGPPGPLSMDAFLKRCQRRWTERGLDGCGLHEARHSFASMLIEAFESQGIDAELALKRISTWMGHTSVTFTLDQYGKLFKRSRSEDLAVERVNSYLASA